MLPPDLLHAIAHEGGGRVVLVVGAGASVDPPTGLPLASECADDAHRQLVGEGVLSSGDCADPTDLSAVADAVFGKTGSQAEMVVRLPRERFTNAVPNEGHKLAAALLRERALASVLTLNFDLALSHALVAVGATTDVSQIRGPEDQAQLAAHNLVYLHRTSLHDPELWILRTETLDEAWKDAWEEAITHRVMTAPVVVFAGLGSPAAVLTETVDRLRSVLGAGVRVLQVDVVDRSQSRFADQLALDDDDYIQLGWDQFMRLLADRILTEQLQRLQRACDELCKENGWPPEDTESLVDAIAAGGLTLFGRLRSRWMIEDQPYLPEYACDVSHVADLALAIGIVQRESNTTAHPDDDGVVEFWEGEQLRGSVAFVSARGRSRWGTVEALVGRARKTWRRRKVEPRKVVVGGVVGARDDVSPPESIVETASQLDIIRGPATVQYVAVDDLRLEDPRVEELLSV